MTYHVKCPLSGKTFDFENLVATRRFVIAIMKREPRCDRKIRIMDGKMLYGTMWKERGLILYRSKGRSKVWILNDNGTRRM